MTLTSSTTRPVRWSGVPLQDDDGTLFDEDATGVLARLPRVGVPMIWRQVGETMGKCYPPTECKKVVHTMREIDDVVPPWRYDRVERCCAHGGRAKSMHVMFPAKEESQLVREFFGERGVGFFVEVGANEPQIGSQTFCLEQLGWQGILIEPQPELADLLRAVRKTKVFAIACSAPENSGHRMLLNLAGIYSSLNAQLSNAKAQISGTIEVPVRTLDEVLEEARAPKPIDFLSIDVEGHEIEVLRGFSFQKWLPNLILIEDLVFNRRLHHFLTARDYVWMRRTGINSWYVPKSNKIKIGAYGWLQFFRKYYLGVPMRQFRQISRRLRRRMGFWPAPGLDDTRFSPARPHNRLRATTGYFLDE